MGNKLQELAQKISTLAQQPELNPIEQDLLRSYLLQMYEVLLPVAGGKESIFEPVEKQIPEPPAPVAGESIPEVNDPQPLYEEIKSETTLVAGFQEEITAPAEEEILSLFNMPPMEEEEEKEKANTSANIESLPAEPPPAPEVKRTETPQNVIQLISSERIDEEKLKDRIATDQKTLADKMLLTPIDNIKSHVTLNKKVAYIIGLFNQESDDYNKALDQLNTAENLQDALNTFHMLRTRYNWKSDLELARELEQLVRRRYATSAN